MIPPSSIKHLFCRRFPELLEKKKRETKNTTPVTPTRSTSTRWRLALSIYARLSDIIYELANMLDHILKKTKIAPSTDTVEPRKGEIKFAKKRPASRRLVSSRASKVRKIAGYSSNAERNMEPICTRDGKVESSHNIIDLTFDDSDSEITEKESGPASRITRDCNSPSNDGDFIKQEVFDEEGCNSYAVINGNRVNDTASQANICTLRTRSAGHGSELDLRQPTRADLAERDVENFSKELMKSEETRKVQELKAKELREDLERRLSCIQSERDDLEQRFVQEQKAKENVEDGLRASREKCEGLKHALEEALEKLKTSEEKMNDQRKEPIVAREAESNVNSVQEENKSLRQALKAKEADFIQLSDQYDARVEETAIKVTAVKTTNANLMAEISVIEAEKETLETELADAKDANASLLQELSEARLLITELRATQSSHMTTRPDTSDKPGETQGSKEAPAESLTDLPTPASSDLEQRTDNVRKTYFRVKKKYDQVYAIAHSLSALAKGLNLSNFGEFGSYLRQLRKAVEEGDEDADKG
jgi:DNA repair exonuclease SbcCD ATPase subunit